MQALLDCKEVLIASSFAMDLIEGQVADMPAFYVLSPAEDLNSLLARR